MDPRIIVKGNATVTLRARSATSELTFTAARPTQQVVSIVQFTVTDAKGNIGRLRLHRRTRLFRVVQPDHPAARERQAPGVRECLADGGGLGARRA